MSVYKVLYMFDYNAFILHKRHSVPQVMRAIFILLTILLTVEWKQSTKYCLDFGMSFLSHTS